MSIEKTGISRAMILFVLFSCNHVCKVSGYLMFVAFMLNAHVIYSESHSLGIFLLLNYRFHVHSTVLLI